MKMVLVKDIVDRDLYFVAPTHSVADVSRKMAELNIGAIIVMENGRLSGVFSERDLLTRVILNRLDPEATPVSQVMTTQVATVQDTAGVETAMESMRYHQCRHLPVVRGEEVVGFLSMRDLMHRELLNKTEELHRMRAYIHGVA
jgi:CBS domain-containing protein